MKSAGFSQQITSDSIYIHNYMPNLEQDIFKQGNLDFRLTRVHYVTLTCVLSTHITIPVNVTHQKLEKEKLTLLKD